MERVARVAAVEPGRERDQGRELHQHLDHVLEPHELPEGVAVVGVRPDVIAQPPVGEGDRERVRRHDLVAPVALGRAGG